MVVATGSALGQNNVVYAWRNLAGQPGGLGSADGTNGAAQFYSPAGVAVDSAGNLFVADTWSDN